MTQAVGSDGAGSGSMGSGQRIPVVDARPDRRWACWAWGTAAGAGRVPARAVLVISWPSGLRFARFLNH